MIGVWHHHWGVALLSILDFIVVDVVTHWRNNAAIEFSQWVHYLHPQTYLEFYCAMESLQLPKNEFSLLQGIL
jgi:hypothetical protein